MACRDNESVIVFCTQVDGDIPTRVKRNAHELILDFIRSRPPLRPVSANKCAAVVLVLVNNQSQRSNTGFYVIRMRDVIKPTLASRELVCCGIG